MTHEPGYPVPDYNRATGESGHVRFKHGERVVQVARRRKRHTRLVIAGVLVCWWLFVIAATLGWL